MHVNIDGDILVYRCGFSAQKTCHKFKKDEVCYDFGPHKTKTQVYEFLRNFYSDEDIKKGLTDYLQLDPVGFARHSVKNSIQKILTDCHCTNYTVYLTSTDKSNFRYKVDPKYKESRSKTKRPHYYKELREYLIRYHPTVEVFGYEADDALGIHQTSHTIIASIDKDLRMIPGKHYNIISGEMEEITKDGHLSLIENGKKRKLVGGGILWLYAQMLLGDSVDDIHGVPRCGPVKVYNLLKDKTLQEAKEVVVKQYKKAFKGDAEQRLKTNYKLLKILESEEEYKKVLGEINATNTTI